jgi:outer membrane protein assembly factor BamB
MFLQMKGRFMQEMWTAVAVVMIGTLASGSDWPGFRGPTGQGVSDQKDLPVKWDAKTNIVWKTDLPGPGSSSPVILGDRIYLTCYSDYGLKEGEGDIAKLKYHLLSVDRKSGKINWTKEGRNKAAQPQYRGFMAEHGYASSTPAIDADGVLTLFGTTLTAWTHEGQVVWEQSIGDEIFKAWGAGSSPVIHNGLVFAVNSVEDGSLIALDRKTGKQAWKKGGIVRAWDTPVLVEAGGRTELVLSAKGKIVAVDPATGADLWSADGIDDYVCPNIVSNAGVIYAIGGRKPTALAIKAGGKGDVTKTNTLWRIDKANNVTSPVYHDGYLYWAHDKSATVHCVNANDGSIAYIEKLEPATRGVYAPPIIAEGRIYYTGRDGKVFVVAARPKFEILAVNTIEGDQSTHNASFAVSGSQLFLRSDKAMYCIGK